MVNHEQITIDGVRTRVSSSGDGPPLVLIHGLGGPQMWERVFVSLSLHFRVVSFDLPGFGEENPAPRPLSTEEYARFIMRGIDILALQNVTLCGISYGGQVAIVCATRYPERISKLVLIAPTGLGPPRWFARSDFAWGIIRSFLRHTILRSKRLLDIAGRRSFYNIANRPDDFVERFYCQVKQNGRGSAYLRCLRNVLACDVDLKGMLSKLRVHTLLVWGENDRAISVAMAGEFHQLLASSALIIIPKCGHSLPLEKPDELCPSILRFRTE